MLSPLRQIFFQILYKNTQFPVPGIENALALKDREHVLRGGYSMRRWIRMDLMAWFFPILLFVFLLASCDGSSSNGDDDNSTDDTLGLPPVVFIAEKSFEGVEQLYITTDEGESFTDLSKRTPQMDEVKEFKISPDGDFVAFVANRAASNRFDLFVTTISGDRQPVNFTNFTLSSQEVTDFEWAPDSSRLAFIADPVTPGSPELFTTDGSNRRRLSGSLASFTEVKEFKWAPDSSLIAYLSDRNSIDNYQLFVSRPDSTDTFEVRSDPLSVSSSQVFAFAWAPDSERIAYTSNANFFNRRELFTTVAEPGTSRSIRTVSELPADGREVVDFAWEPIDGERIAYTADQDTDDLNELYTTLPDVNRDSTKVSGTLTALSDGITAFEWAPDGTLIAYTADQDTEDIIELFTSFPDTSTGNVKVSGTIDTSQVPPVDNRHEVESFDWAPDSSLLAFSGISISSGFGTELFTTDPDVSDSVVKISGTIVPGGNVDSFSWAPDSSRVAYRADQDTLNVIELYTSLPDTAVGNTKVSGKMQASGSVRSDFKWAEDTSGLGYVADQITDEVFELFETLPDGSKSKKVSGTLALNGDVYEFDFVPD